MAAMAPVHQDKLRRRDMPRIMLGGFTALAASAWMGSVQASAVLEPLRIVGGYAKRLRPTIPNLQGLSLGKLLTREYPIAQASFILRASFFTSAALGTIRQVMFNAQFGVGSEVNAYYAAFRLPDTLFSLVASGALSSAMIPILLTTSLQEGVAAGARLVNIILTTLVAFIVLIVIALELCTPSLVQNLLAPGFDAETSALTVTLTRIMLIQPMILAVASVATAVLNGRNQFMLPALALIIHTVALPAYVATEVITRGLIALRDTRTPLATNIFQLVGRFLILSLLIEEWSIVAIPIALAVTSSLETIILGVVLWLKLSRRVQLVPAGQRGLSHAALKSNKRIPVRGFFIRLFIYT